MLYVVLFVLFTVVVVFLAMAILTDFLQKRKDKENADGTD